jgi:hypothetical protein
MNPMDDFVIRHALYLCVVNEFQNMTPLGTHTRTVARGSGALWNCT